MPSVERDPWDTEDNVQVGSPDPWEKPEKKKLKGARVPQELTQMRSTDDTAWPVKWRDESERAPSKMELEARKKREHFLYILSETGSPTQAAAKAGLSKRAIVRAKENFPDFKANYALAKEVYFMFGAEETLRHRVIDGTLEPIVYQGRVMGYKRVYDSGLTQFWYKHNMPDKYGDKSEVKISGTINHGVAMLPPKVIDHDAWEKQNAKTVADQAQNIIDITPQVVETPSSNGVTVARK